VRVFHDRRDAGRQLGQLLAPLRGEDVVVLGLPRGGVPVAAEVAAVLRAPLDVVLVRKLGVPWQPELAMGAVGEGGVVVRNERVLEQVEGADDAFGDVLRREQAELARRSQLLRGDRPPLGWTDRVAVLVDDGVATGATAVAAAGVVRAGGAGRVVLAVPVAPPAAVARMAAHADEVVVVQQPARFTSVGAWYRDFTQTADDEVVRLLAAADRDEL